MKSTTMFAAAAAASIIGFAANAQTMTAEGSNPGSSNLTAIMTLAELAGAEGIADFQVQDGQTLTNSLVNVAEGSTDVAPVPLIAPFLLSRGAGPYASIGGERGTELIGIVAGLEDGVGYEGVQSNWGQMSQFISDGSGDGVVLPIYFPDERMTQASAAGAMTMYSVPKEAYESEAFQRYLASPGTVGYEIPVSELPSQEGVTISSEDDTWRSPMTAGAVVVSTSMDFDTAKALTALMLDNMETFLGKAPYMRFVQLGKIAAEDTGMCGPNPIKYHPGAVAAWEEAGFTVPDCAKPQS